MSVATPKDEEAGQVGFWDGVKACLPLLAGILPFALIAGAAAVEVGLPFTTALCMSWVVFAGAAQLALLALIGHEAPVYILILTALIINLRFTMYSSLIAPYFKDMNLARRSLFAYLLSDQACLLSLPVMAKAKPLESARLFYLGSAITLWMAWQLGCAVGVILGKTLPESWHLDFAVPLSFLALLVPLVRTKPSLAAALAGGISILWTHHLPLHLGLIVATAIGAATGAFCEGLKS